MRQKRLFFVFSQMILKAEKVNVVAFEKFFPHRLKRLVGLWFSTYFFGIMNCIPNQILNFLFGFPFYNQEF